jgi:hypothetical protein
MKRSDVQLILRLLEKVIDRRPSSVNRRPSKAKHCPTCHCESEKVYDSNAARQKAYRNRQRAKKLAAARQRRWRENQRKLHLAVNNKP